MDFSEKRKISLRACFLYNKILIKRSWLKTKNIESTERWKTSLPKEIVKNADPHKPLLKNNDHARVMRKYDFVAPSNNHYLWEKSPNFFW